MKALRAPNGRELSKAGIVVGAYLLWKNRFKIQEMLESIGIRTPWMGDNLDSVTQSGGAKIKGAVKRAFRPDESRA